MVVVVLLLFGLRVIDRCPDLINGHSIMLSPGLHDRYEPERIHLAQDRMETKFLFVVATVNF